MVDHRAERPDDLRRQSLERPSREGHRSEHTPLGWAIDRGQRRHAEAQLADGDAALAQPLADGVRQQRQLVSPHAARHAQKENPVVKRNRVRSLGDARSDGVAPQLGRKRRVGTREPALSGAVEDGLERLGRRQGQTGGPG